MITHVVLVEWARPVDADELSGLIDTRLRPLPIVDTVVEGASVSPEGLEAGFDWGMVVGFADEEARDAYLVDPDHAVVGSWLQSHASRIAVFDLES